MDLPEAEPRAGDSRGYLIAIVATVASILLRWLLDPWIGDALPFVTLFGAVAVAAFYGGYGPALVATALCFLGAEWLFVGTHGPFFRGQDYVGALLYLLTCAIIIGLAEAMRATQRGARTRLELLRVTFASIGDGVILTDLEGRVTALNRVAESLTGYRTEEAEGRPLHEVFRLVDEETGRTVENPVVRVLAEGKPRAILEGTVLIAKDGTERPVDDSAAPIRDGQQKLLGAVLVFRDVTESKRAARRLLAKEAELDLVTSGTPVLLMRCSRDMRYLFVNRACAEFLRRPLEELVGRRVPEVIGEAAFAAISPHVEAVLRGEHVQFELEVPYAGLGPRFMQALYTPDRDEDGNVVGWIATVADISSRKRAELALRESETRHRELAGALKEADRRKDEFLAILAHELRNPLAPLRSAAHLLQMGTMSEAETKRAAEIVERQVSQMARLIDDLLDVSRVARGMIALQRERVDFAAIVEAAVDGCRNEIEERGHTLTVQLPDERVVLDADRHRLVQVFGNLVSNAAKFTPRGGRIELAAHVSGELLEVRVRDNGIGIPADKRAEIFDLFAQVDRSLGRESGLGIGLTLARQLIALHGGQIEAHSEGLGHGSTFVARIPVAAPMPDLEERATPAALERAPSRRVLVADDNRDAAESMALILERAGHDVRLALDGDAALALAAEFRPEVAFLDIGMPKRDGYEVARRIRLEAWGRTMRLVALTGWGQEDDRLRSRDAGFDAHLVKPIAPADLDRFLAPGVSQT